MQILGYDLGSSSVKASIIDTETGSCIASAFYPKEEMPMQADKPGWAEQDPEMWWKFAVMATRDILQQPGVKKEAVSAIGISYQMHGLVIVDRDYKPIRPSIIWCDSRAVNIGEKAFESIGRERCLASHLNSPGNFTASKLAWVKENEPDIFEKIYKIMLPGDYLAMKLTGEIMTTPSGLSEGIMWDFENNDISSVVLDHFGFDRSMIPDIVPVFSVQGKTASPAAEELGIKAGIPVTYRAGDQPNNAFSLNVLNPGEIAATAGTSGVVYGISDKVMYDPESRVNTFAHVNHSPDNNRLGVLLCINGTGILNSWVKRNVAGGISYEEINSLAASVGPGSNGVTILPFGNGSERMLGNRYPGCQISGVDFNSHSNDHIMRAAQEGIVFAFRYGMDIMKSTGINPTIIRAGHSNMFLSSIFRESLASITGASIELYNTDGSQGAARAAGIGAGIFSSPGEAFGGLNMVERIEPVKGMLSALEEAYSKWEDKLQRVLKHQS
jgi:xylulokinase